MEKTKASATDIVIELEKLKSNIQERRDYKFMPQGAKKLFKTLEENGNINAGMIVKEITNFYNRCLSYIQLWENSFDEAQLSVWINKNDITWPQIETSAEKINETLGNVVIR